LPPMVAALNNARELYNTWKLQEALDAYNAILKTNPDIPMAYVGIARVDLRMKKPADAYAAASQALKMSPNFVQAHVAMGEVLFRQGKIWDANVEFEKMVKSGAEDARAYLGLARVFFANSNYRHAVYLVDRAHELDPDDSEIQREWIFTLSRKERLEALRGFLDDPDSEDEEDRDHLKKHLTDMEDADTNHRACHLVTKPDHAELSLEQLNESATYVRAVGLKVHMGQASPTLMLDTGAHGFLVDRRVAEKADIRRVVDEQINGIGDKKATNGYYGVASSIKIGDLEFVDCEVFVTDQRSVIGDDGLIGADVFSHYLVDINLPQKKMVLSELPPLPELSDADKKLGEKYANAAKLRDRYISPEMKDYAMIFRFGHQLLIPTRVNKGDVRLFMIDTGAFGNSISPDAARDVTKVHEDPNMHVKGLSGNVQRVYSADNVMLTFSRYYLKANDVVSFDTTHISDTTDTEVSGFLGFSMLRVLDMKIDYRDGLVDFNYNPNQRF
jgi:tetratricopeptide (TPR) repeat protein